MRRFLLLLFIISSMIGLAACNTKVAISTADNTPTPYPTNAIMTPIVIEDEIRQNEYEIVENTSNLSKDETINYPQISGMMNTDKQEKINKLILEDIMKYVECFKGGGITIEITYDISWKSTELLSVRYYLYYYSEGAAHPNNYFYTININLDNASKLKFSDIINISDDLINKFKKDCRYIAPYDNSEELMELLRKGMNLLDLASLTNADAGDNFEEMYIYFTEDSLGFSISVPHVYGDYALYEIKYNEIKDYIKDDKSIWNEFSEVLSTPVFSERELLLTEEDKQELGILIKWIYNDNVIYHGEDANEIQLPDNIELLTTDLDKINFIINIVVFENMMNSIREDMIYSFKAEDADTLIEAAIGDKFDEHNSNEVEYQDGTYYYSIVGADGAMWWPGIEIDKVTAISEEKARVEGKLINKHDIYTKVYSYDFEAVVSINQDSPFGGFTLEELDILSEIVTDTALANTEKPIEMKPTQELQTIGLNNNLCAVNEEVLICFPIADSKKRLSICIEKSQQEYIVYRFGTKEKIELEYPDDKADSWSKFLYSYYLRAGGRENEGLDLNYLTFESSGYSYKIYQEYSAESDETKVGIMVTNLSTSEEIQIEGLTDGLVGNLINLRDNDKITIEY